MMRFPLSTQTYYEGGVVSRWIITKACGACPTNLEVLPARRRPPPSAAVASPAMPARPSAPTAAGDPGLRRDCLPGRGVDLLPGLLLQVHRVLCRHQAPPPPSSPAARWFALPTAPRCSGAATPSPRLGRSRRLQRRDGAAAVTGRRLASARASGLASRSRLLVP